MPNRVIIYQKFECNHEGTDYVVGDIHGHFDLLDKALEKIKFDYKKDRLFCTGDLVNKGSKSEKVLKYLQKPWFFSVMGNNDELIGFNKKIENYQKDGTVWIRHTNYRKLGNIKSYLRKLPVAIELKNKSNQKIGITHADALNKWRNYQNLLLTREDIDFTINSRTAANQAKDNYENPCQRVDGIDYIFHGHTINHKTKDYYTIANRIFIDCGAHKNNEKNKDYDFCIFSIDSLDDPVYTKGS